MFEDQYDRAVKPRRVGDIYLYRVDMLWKRRNFAHCKFSQSNIGRK